METEAKCHVNLSLYYNFVIVDQEFSNQEDMDFLAKFKRALCSYWKNNSIRGSQSRYATDKGIFVSLMSSLDIPSIVKNIKIRKTLTHAHHSAQDHTATFLLKHGGL